MSTQRIITPADIRTSLRDFGFLVHKPNKYANDGVAEIERSDRAEVERVLAKAPIPLVIVKETATRIFVDFA
jgi:hypothetical protein